MVDIMLEHLDWVVGGALLIFTAFSGKILENKHFKDLLEREAVAPKIPLVNTKEKNLSFASNTRAELVIGSVELSSDFFRSTLASFVDIFGGRVGVLENLMDRGRREALLRVQEKARGASHLLNVRYTTATLTDPNRGGVPKVEVVVYATAVYP